MESRVSVLENFSWVTTGTLDVAGCLEEFN